MILLNVHPEIASEEHVAQSIPHYLATGGILSCIDGLADDGNHFMG
ncbi:MAG: hypothetical protein ABI383_07810 [Acidobacteriaceae bacterium]